MHCAERLSNDFQRLFEAAAATLSGGGGVAGVDSFSPSLKKKKLSTIIPAEVNITYANSEAYFSK